MMTCEETQQAFSLYVDDRLALPARAAFDQHLQQCPLCRARLAETQSLVRDLGAIARPALPRELESSITAALRIEAAARQKQPALSFSEQVMQWLQPRLMPYTVGAFASLIFFMVMFAALRSSLMAFRDWDVAAKQSQDTVAFKPYSGYDITKPLSAESYAAGRAAFSADSPSLNPHGALASLSRSTQHSNEADDDDDMVIVADVFSNGNASLAGVMQAPRDRRMLEEFQDALRKNPAFVPASFDRRPQTMRVVFVIQKVDVREREF
ncbi:MAG TPA: zf-HC2 domain-containing protein [Pyrinomonadaceae bacterium]|jgi:anti-sigma factor RsiW